MTEHDDLRGHAVVDRDGKRLGLVEDVWADDSSGRPLFASVRTGWLVGRTHVVPLNGARVEDETRTLWVPYASSAVRRAPHLAATDDLDDDERQRVLRHYYEASRDDQVEIPLMGEKLDVSTRVAEQGGVRLRKVVRKEIVYEPVEVLREHVIVERLSPDELAEAERRAAGDENEIVMREWGEVPVVDKHVEHVETVRAQRTREQETRAVEAERRVEDVEVRREAVEPGDEFERT
jgi:sporulation protein YlmC with PRC-barrel domain